MKTRLLASILLAAVAAEAQSAPFLQATADTATATCGPLTGVAGVVTTTVTKVGTTCTWDLNGVAPGSYTAASVAKNSLGVAGPSSSFPFTMPAVPAALSGWQLLP